MNPVEASVHRPYTVAVAVILALLFSWLAWKAIPVQLKPTVDTPKITITTGFRGAGAIEVEEQVTRELEEELQRVEGLTKLISDSSEGRSVVTLEFDFGTDTSLAVVDVINKLSRVQRLPEEADEPRIDIVSEGGVNAIMWLAVKSAYEPNRVRRIVDDEVEARISRVPGVAGLIIAGGAEREIVVRIDPEGLLGHGVTIPDLVRSLTGSNLNIRGGTVETATRRWVVRTVGRADIPERLEQIVVKETGGGNVLLGDVATVVDGYAEDTAFVHITGRPGVAMGIQRKTDANVVATIRGVDEVIEDLNKGFRNRGLDVELAPVYRETEYIDQAMDFVTGNLQGGAILCVIVLILFLRSVRSVLIIALSIPISLITVFPVMFALGRTLNVISLAGIAFASGMVVDNAIVVLENIYQHLEKGKSLLRACVDGGREVWGGVLASTLTTVFVFVPILLQGDEASQLFIDIAIAITASVTISLVVALTVVPVLSHLLLRGVRTTPSAFSSQAQAKMPLGFLGRWYASAVGFLTSRWPGSLAAKVGLVLLVVAGSAAAVRIIPPAEYLPTGNRNLVFFIGVPFPGTRPEAIMANFGPLEEWVLAQPESDRMFLVVGPEFNGGGVALKSEFASAAGIGRFQERMKAAAAACPGFYAVVPMRSSIFQNPGKQFEVELSGPDFATLERASREMQGRLQAIPGIQYVRPSLIMGRPELKVTLDEARAKELGLSVADIGTVVETAVAGRRVSTLIEGGKDVDVNVVVPPERVRSPDDLAAFRFLAADGKTPVALGSVARIERVTGPLSVRRLERQRNVLLTVDLAADAPLGEVVQRVEDEVFPVTAAALGPAYSLGFGGAADKLRTTLSSLTGGFGLSILIIYLLLVALFRSWISPFVILTTVPLATAGGILGIRLAADLSPSVGFDVISMLGFIILAGIVVNNSILILHQANNNKDLGMNPRTALATSAKSRMRPILMTVITTVAGMAPLAIGGGAGSELYQGLAAIIAAGLTLSTLFTLFLTPVLVSIGHDLQGVPNDVGPPVHEPEPGVPTD